MAVHGDEFHRRPRIGGFNRRGKKGEGLIGIEHSVLYGVALRSTAEQFAPHSTELLSKHCGAFAPGSKAYGEERPATSRLPSDTRSGSLRSRASSKGSWDGPSVKSPKSTNERRGKKIVAADPFIGHGKGKIMSEHTTNQAEDYDQEWIALSN
ncbi:unnamed protein product [Fraxinus pennsylvanica]|uniref:Uncharacterized protein n=1 Tax=Fraxinus pennsylvanica TaxID=56036 RepID=A0AAD2EE87_9LAMI|nr:unnamed protein product [Fraxinus pennsylvanica]